MKTCPEGFYCLDYNFFYLFCFIIFGLIVWEYIKSIKNNTLLAEKDSEIYRQNLEREKKDKRNTSQHTIIRERESSPPYIINNGASERSRIFDPLAPPERMYPYSNSGGVPINIPTRGYGPGYHQVGILEKTSIDSESTIYDTRPQILPLYGKPTYPGSNKWFYYTSSDMNGFKIPFTINGKTCNDDYGCNELYSGDKVDLSGYNAKYKVTIYSIDSPKYIPYILG